MAKAKAISLAEQIQSAENEAKLRTEAHRDRWELEQQKAKSRFDSVRKIEELILTHLESRQPWESPDNHPGPVRNSLEFINRLFGSLTSYGDILGDGDLIAWQSHSNEGRDDFRRNSTPLSWNSLPNDQNREAYELSRRVIGKTLTGDLRIDDLSPIVCRPDSGDLSLLFLWSLLDVIEGKRVILTQPSGPDESEKDESKRIAVSLPKWDADAKELWFEGKMIHKYSGNPAIQQTKLLQAFEDAGWRQAIPDPTPDIEGKLKETIRAFKESLGRSPISFRAVGGNRVEWMRVNT